MGNYVERAILTLRIASLASPILVAEKLLRNPPLNIPGLIDAFIHSMYRILVLILMTFRGKKRENMARVIQKVGIIKLLKLY